MLKSSSPNRTKSPLIPLNEDSPAAKILSNRPILMGAAMIMVITYHFFSWVYNPINSFNIGYVGVDIFMFLSGLGLSSSYRKNSIFHFYRNRVYRIYPIYFLSLLTTYLFFKLNWNITDLALNILTIGIYTKEGLYRYDWFLESLFSLYLLFPIFYLYGKTRIKGIVLLLFVVVLVLYNYNISWWYECILGRLPIFVYGAAFKECGNSYKDFSLLGIILYFPCRIMISPFLASSMLALPIMMILLAIQANFPLKIKKILSYVGNHSLEIYIANLYVYWTFETTPFSTAKKLLIFILLQFIMTIILVKLNNNIRQLLTKQ